MLKKCQRCREEIGTVEVEEYVRTTLTGPTYRTLTLGDDCYILWQEQEYERSAEMTIDE